MSNDNESRQPSTAADGYIAALTPSAETKAAYIGEFTMPVPCADEDGEEVLRSFNVPWTTIKEIMAAIRKYAEAARPSPQGEDADLDEISGAIEYIDADAWPTWVDSAKRAVGRLRARLASAQFSAQGEEAREAVAFIRGAKWWEYHSTQGTMWQSDQALAADEAEKRYGHRVTAEELARAVLERKEEGEACK